ncbi:MAG TPA: hypothetical protein VM077_06100 [Candidatus Limnocylindrales bacterium]|nr:hypothetical protein [Candidatus Limnocylindrales bacterium]
MTETKKLLDPLLELDYVEASIRSYAGEFTTDLITSKESKISSEEGRLRSHLVHMVIPGVSRLVVASPAETLSLAFELDKNPTEISENEKTVYPTYIGFHNSVRQAYLDIDTPVERAELEAVKQLKLALAPRVVRNELSGSNLLVSSERLAKPRLEIVNFFAKDVVNKLTDGTLRKIPAP